MPKTSYYLGRPGCAPITVSTDHEELEYQAGTINRNAGQDLYIVSSDPHAFSEGHWLITLAEKIIVTKTLL